MKKQDLILSINYYILSLVFLFIFPLKIVSQDSIPEKKDLTEEAELKFQQFFFKALSEKAIGNHSKAIENLESCNEILEENEVVFFEFSKNYLELNNPFLAKEYINRALEKDPNNIWMLKHLVKINVKDKNYNDAINIQNKLVALNPKERDYLVRLFFYNREYKKALDLINTLDNENVLSPSLKRLRDNLENRKGIKKQTNSNKEISLIEIFEKEKSLDVLLKLLEKYNNNPEIILKYSAKGINLYPSQSLLYLKKGQALYKLKKYKESLVSLETGLDFVFEEEMEVQFYAEMANVYKQLGNLDKERQYLNKIKKLKN